MLAALPSHADVRRQIDDAERGETEKHVMVIAVCLTLQPDQTLFGDAESPRKSVWLGSRLAVMSCTQMPSQFTALCFLLLTQRASKTSLFSFVIAAAGRR